MSNRKHIFNADALTFEKECPSFWSKVIKLLRFSCICLSFSALFLVIEFNVINSPKESHLEDEISQMRVKYNLLNNKIASVTHLLTHWEWRDNNLYRPMLNADTIPSSIRRAGFGGSDRYKDLEGYANSPVIIETARNMDVLTHEVFIQARSFDELEKLAKNKTLLLHCIPAIRPLDPTESKGITSGYGWRINPIYKTKEFHAGIDFAASEGTPIHAAGDGIVERADDLDKGFGNSVMINHGFGYETLYAHMSRMAVTAGEKVKRGQVIGYVGCTGLCTGDHVHYGVFKNGQTVNPIDYFYMDTSPAEYKAIVQVALGQNQLND